MRQATNQRIDVCDTVLQRIYFKSFHMSLQTNPIYLNSTLLRKLYNQCLFTNHMGLRNSATITDESIDGLRIHMNDLPVGKDLITFDTYISKPIHIYEGTKKVIEIQNGDYICLDCMIPFDCYYNVTKHQEIVHA